MMTLSEFNPAFMVIEERGPVVVARISRQSLTDEENIEELGQEFTMLIDHFGLRQLVVDMEAVGMVTSAALGKLISLHRNLHRREGRLVICGVKGMVQDVMRSSRLMEYFKMAETSDAAVAMLNPSAV